jgi:hypothetical protein
MPGRAAARRPGPLLRAAGRWPPSYLSWRWPRCRAPTVSSSGADLATLESYLLSQPGISAELAAQIRAIADPSSTLPVPVPAGAASSTVDLNGHAAVVLSRG